MTKQMYAVPVSPWALDALQLDRLRARVQDAEEQVVKTTDWVERTRAEQHMKALQRELHSAEFEAVLEGKRASAQQARQPEPLIRSDCGTKFLPASNNRKPLFAEPVTYFAKLRRQEPIVTNTDQRRSPSGGWPETFSERTALVQAAIKALRRAVAA